MTQPSSFRMAHGLNLLPPKDDQAYPIPCGEWDLLKERIGKLSDSPWFFHTAGSILLGASATTLIAIFLGTMPSDKPTTAIAAWAVVAVTALSGALCLLFSTRERAARRVSASEIVAQMELIEKRYEGRAA